MNRVQRRGAGRQLEQGAADEVDVELSSRRNGLASNNGRLNEEKRAYHYVELFGVDWECNQKNSHCQLCSYHLILCGLFFDYETNVISYSNLSSNRCTNEDIFIDNNFILILNII